MKTILRQFLNQQNAMNGRGIVIQGVLKWMKDNPVLFLWGVWFIYLGLDLLLRYFGSMPIAPFDIILWNFIGWGMINQFWFFVFLPNAMFFRRWKLETMILILVFLGFVLFKLFLLGKWTELELQLFPFLVNESVRSLQFLLYTSAIWGFYVLAISQDEFNKMEIDLIKLRIEHKSLQLSPHFVLNMVSQFSASILSLSRPLYDSLSRFTDILAYSYKNPQHENSLAHEIHAMENYVACQRQRFGDTLQFVLIKELGNLETNKLPLPKWTLMTLLENVFKHGDCFNPSKPARLEFRMDELQESGSVFIMSLTNTPDLATPVKSSEFGIDAVRRILEHHFPGKFRMSVEKSPVEFNLLLHISYGKNPENRPLG
ncbi:hypothetical protein GCM10009119_19280 [Algoriphagus jejuensis]|uniref:Signal transduction histidine kinase internal region domain-containing protein n=1 Tax=Algoriphagus jejuensis TaxID=419934 RepID=A0ABN1N092_9BACT